MPWLRSRVAQSDLQGEERTWLDRLGIEVVVAKHGSEGPRYEVSISLPVAIESALIRNPNRELLVSLEGETAYGTPPES